MSEVLDKFFEGRISTLKQFLEKVFKNVPEFNQLANELSNDSERFIVAYPSQLPELFLKPSVNTMQQVTFLAFYILSDILGSLWGSLLHTEPIW